MTDLKNRIFGAGHRVLTVVGALAGGLVALGQYLDLVPEPFRSSKWYAVAAALVALGSAMKMPAKPAAIAPPAVIALLAAGALLAAAPARAQEATPAPAPHLSLEVGTLRGQPITLTAGLGVSGYGYDFGTKQVLRGVAVSGLGELAVAKFPIALLAGGGFQTGTNQGLAIQVGPEYQPLGLAVLFNAVVVGSTRSFGLVAGYVFR